MCTWIACAVSRPPDGTARVSFDRQGRLDTGLAVMDASVAVKWFLDEEYGDEALRLQSDFFEGVLSLRVPSILPYEVLNALQHSRRFRGRDLLEAARDIDRSGFSVIPLFGEYMERTAEIPVRLRSTTYDASYLALAA